MKLSGLELRRPRAFGNCWLACETWRQLELDRFRRRKLPEGREAVSWEKILRLLVVNRLIDPGGELYVHRHWFLHSAMEELRGIDFAVAEKDRLYRCLDRVISHKRELFMWLRQRGPDLFQAGFEVPLHDLTGTYFEGAMEENPKAKRGCGRDGRPDCSQVVIAPVVTTDGFPTAYEARNGNTSDRTALRGFLDKIEAAYGKAGRMWVMDRGIPTEEILTELRAADSGVRYLVGTPKARLTRYEAALAERPWRDVRPHLRVKLLPQDGELYVLAESQARAGKERGMRRRRLKAYWQRLGALARQRPPRDALLTKLGAAQEKAGRGATSLVQVEVAADSTLTYRLDREKLRAVRGREGRYLLRTNLSADDPELIWRCYMQLCFVEEAFRTLKGDLGLRPIFHQLPERIEAHLFIAFLAYCLSITLRQQLRTIAGGLMPRTVLEKLATVQMLDVAVPTTDGRELLLVRRTEPGRDVQLLLDHLNLTLPPQPPPRIRVPQAL